MPEDPDAEAPSAQIDTNVPSIARAYDALVGGKDHYEVDRKVLRQILEVSPEAHDIVRSNRQWLIRVCRFLAHTAKIDQFLDCGSGLPTAENTHQAVQRLNPEATVVYVDNDPVVLAHGRALLEENDRTHFAAADLTEPRNLLVHPTITRYLEFDRPLALIQCGTLHHINDLSVARKVMDAYISALPSGSYVAVTHMYNPRDGSRAAEIAQGFEDVFQRTMGTAQYRTYDEIAGLLTGLELVEPGLTYLHDWWPDGPQIGPLGDVMYTLLGAVGRKP
jgi:SAM-dependent methyltransferase